jgi:hypothetical protein
LENFAAEIGNGGEGGLYAELIQDRSFDALARTTGFLYSNATSLTLSSELLTAAYSQPVDPFGGVSMEDSPALSRGRKGQLRKNSPAFLG